MNLHWLLVWPSGSDSWLEIQSIEVQILVSTNKTSLWKKCGWLMCVGGGVQPIYHQGSVIHCYPKIPNGRMGGRLVRVRVSWRWKSLVLEGLYLLCTTINPDDHSGDKLVTLHRLTDKLPIYHRYTTDIPPTLGWYSIDMLISAFDRYSDRNPIDM